MSGRPRPDLVELQRVLGRAAVPDSLTAEGRMAMLIAAAESLLDSDAPAGLFVGGALLRWAEMGGDLVRDHLRLGARRGSHTTPQALFRRVKSSPKIPHRL